MMSTTQDQITDTWQAAHAEGQGVWELDIIFRGDDLGAGDSGIWAMMTVGQLIIKLRKIPLRCLLCEEERAELPDVVTLMHADVSWPTNVIAHVVCADCAIQHDRPKIIDLCWDRWCEMMPGLRRIDRHTHEAGHA